MLQRIIRELHRPDLLGQVQDFARDAIRHWSRQPFFFTEIDNTDIGGWAGSLFVPYGYTIRETADDGNEYIFVALTSGNNGTVIPTFDHRLFTLAAQPGPIFNVGDFGTTVDNEVTWATVEAWPDSRGPASNKWTQLSTVPTINQIIPPIDYVAPTTVEITAANLRYELGKTSYRNLRKVDVIRPAPVTVYPTDYAFYQKRIYCWPYPIQFFPITLSYYSAPFPPRAVTDSNFWTTTAERLIRCYTKHIIHRERMYDPEAAAMELENAESEKISLQDQEREQQSQEGPSPEAW
jgi:hypothetical protein